MVGRMKVEIYPAKRAFVFALTEDDGHLTVQGNAVAQLRRPIFVGCDGFAQKGNKRGAAVLRRLVEANDIFVVVAQGFLQFRLKCVFA